METNRLKQFCVVHETGNLRKAAEILNMSHSALSKSLKVLQDEIGIRLLEQNGRGILVTDAGKEFVHKAQSLLDLENRILTRSFTAPDQFKIGSFESFSTHLLGMKWQNYFGPLPLQIHELSSGQIEKAVSEGTIDVGITYEPIPTKDLEFITLGKVKMGIYHRKGFFKKSSFESLPFVAPLMPSVGTPSSAKGLDGWPDHEFPRNIRFRVDLMESGLALVRAGAAVIFIPDFVAVTQNYALGEDFKFIERDHSALSKKVERRIFLIVKNSRQKEKNIRTLADLIKRECTV